ncbi:hypothetical protein KUCAC02_021891 [Chaenocephalus aceratus]|uniref:Uncharacterized protein n=1 Tax=Chaenocephalus aceratus TaxID=36190 RepID=A0ACB9XIJ9_CHAAC|nr:hypothetical protein KUCAC02_021891 [Chaenocephalus aceratus]
MRTARPESPSWPRDHLVLAWARQTRGHRTLRLLGSQWVLLVIVRCTLGPVTGSELYYDKGKIRLGC